MAYDSTKLACLGFTQGGPVGFNLWIYDTTDSHATVDTAGYFTTAAALNNTGQGMEKGDLVIVRVWSSAVPDTNAKKRTADATASVLSTIGIHVVKGINATTGAADLADVLAITVTNTD